MAKEIGYAARKKRERENSPREGDTTMKEGNKFVFKNGQWVKATPASQGSRRNAARKSDKPNTTNKRPAVGNLSPSEGTGKKAETTLGYGSSAPKSTPKPAPKPAAQDAPKPTTPKPIPKPAEKVPSSNAGMKNQNKDFRGNPNRKDSIASTLSELRSMGSGRKVEGVGPVASGSDYAKSKNISQAQSDANKARIKQGPGAKNETLKERMERMKKRRQGTSIGGVD